MSGQTATPTAAPTQKEVHWRFQEIMLASLPIAVIVILFSLANLVGLGKYEFFFVDMDPFFWTRRVWLGVSALLGIGLMQHTLSPRRIIQSLGWHRDRTVITVAVLLGALLGMLTPLQRAEGSWGILLTMAAMHVFTEVLFFQGLVTRVVARHTADLRAAIMVSGIVYGMYRLTFYNHWFQMDMLAKLVWISSAIVGVGMPAAWMTLKTRSVLHALVFQGMIHGVMLVHALWG